MPAQTWVEPVVLEGRASASSRSAPSTSPTCALVAFDPPLWRWTIMGPQDEAGLRALGRDRPGQRRGRHGAAVRDHRPRLAAGPIGSSRYLSIVPEHRRLEIGWTWVGTAFQRTGANREAKLLQLTHAFETLGANRVEFKTHSRNERSRTALAGIGATFEGVFRNHMIMPDGSIRHSAYFSVTAEEWPAVKARRSMAAPARTRA